MALTRAQRAILRSKRRQALRAKRAEQAKIDADLAAEEEDEDQKPSPTTSKKPKFNAKDLLAALGELPPAALGAVVAGGIVAAVAAGTVAFDAQIDAGDDRIRAQEQQDYLDTFPDDLVDVVNKSRGLRPEVVDLEEQMAAMAAQMADFEELIDGIKLNAATKDELAALQAIADQNAGNITNVNADTSALQRQVNAVAADTATAQAAAVDAAESATAAQVSADTAIVAAGTAQTAADEAQAVADGIAEDLADERALAQAESAAAQAAADEAKTVADEAQAAADEALIEAKKAVEFLPITKSFPGEFDVIGPFEEPIAVPKIYTLVADLTPGVYAISVPHYVSGTECRSILYVDGVFLTEAPRFAGPRVSTGEVTVTAESSVTIDLEITTTTFSCWVSSASMTIQKTG